ncbi:MAG TPA: AsnC family transcriptional regulator [Patescibacteria group bacterium]|nr:AsnC family transcriptional regulator [Patescibacteria group bacterium]
MLTSFDRKLLNLVQTQLPIAHRPFAQLAERLESDEETVLERLRWLTNHGFIRRIGPFFDSSCLGYVSTLVALQVETAQMDTVATTINQYGGVTHNYQREGEFNLWFTLMAANEEEQARILGEIGNLEGLRVLVSLPATQKYKVSVEFQL